MQLDNHCSFLIGACRVLDNHLLQYCVCGMMSVTFCVVADVAALSEGSSLPYTRVVKETSALGSPAERAMAGPRRQTDPKDHS